MKTDPMNTYTLGTLRILGFLYKHTAATATDLAGVLGKHPSKISTHIANGSLMKNKLVKRSAKGYTLTKKGEKLGERIVIRKGTLTIRDN